MKKVLNSANQIIFNDQAFQRFTEKEILNKFSMNRIRGGDGGVSEIIIPRPPKP